MTTQQWTYFSSFREDFRRQCAEWESAYAEMLRPLILAASGGAMDYEIENPIVYNTALDGVSEASEIKVIVIGDNPGKSEQLSANRKYLIGQSGKIAESFFRKNAEFALDFRKNTIILNKTPVHTAKTAQLKAIAKSDARAAALIRESQEYMARQTAELHINLGTELWLVGYSELKGRGIFAPYREKLRAGYADAAEMWEKVYTFQHFSMNRFAIDLKSATHDGESRAAALKSLGRAHTNEIFPPQAAL